MNKILIIVLLVLWQLQIVAQTNNASPNAAMDSKTSESSINLFTGLPNISIPIYDYKSTSGIGTSVSISYAGGGIQIGESPTMVGLGWHLNVGGSITRTVRGAPDDYPNVGYMYTPVIPTDFRANAEYYFATGIDAEQDIFQFNTPTASGKFFIGKDGSIKVVPLSKIKVIPTFDANGIINSFRIIDENAIKYDFLESENVITYSNWGSLVSTGNGNNNRNYKVKWNLNQIISAFNVDTIKFSYIFNQNDFGFKIPQTALVNDADTSQKEIKTFDVSNTGQATGSKIDSIEFPDKTRLKFIYDGVQKYNEKDYVLKYIKLVDTTLRMGFWLQYKDTSVVWKPKGTGLGLVQYVDSLRTFLKSVTPFTKYEKQNGYSFDYYTVLFPQIGQTFPTYTGQPNTLTSEDLLNSTDYWGFYNNQDNKTKLRIPKVKNYTWGALRNPDEAGAFASTLYKVKLPTGGATFYNYSLNDRLPYLNQSMELNCGAQFSNQLNATLNQVFNDKHNLNFSIHRSILRDGIPPINGNGILYVAIKNSGGTILANTSFSLFELYNNGLKSWSFNLPNGTYSLVTNVDGSTNFTGNFPITISWENRTEDPLFNSNKVGGIRVQNVFHNEDASNELNVPELVEEYNYITEAGKSSGFLGATPKFDFPYTKFVQIGNNPTIINEYTKIISEPLNAMDYTMGSPVGYSRVEVTKKNYLIGKSLGKTVYDFTDLKDVNTNNFTASFPYTPNDLHHFGLGLPKRISVYDSAGILKKRTVNMYQFDTITYRNDNYKSVKVGSNQIVYYGDPNSGTAPNEHKYVGEPYYIENGRSYLTYSYDTIFQSNGTTNTSYQQIVYDTNYNVTKIVSSYDKTRGLQKEERRYYPYNYTVGGALGKLKDSGLLNNIVSSETWIVGDANPRLLAAGITSYKELPTGHIKPDSVFMLESKKPILLSSIGNFNSTILNRNYNLIKPQSQFVAYDNKGDLVETKNLVTGLSNTVITGYENNYTIAQISNATKDDIAYTSFETTTNGYWNVPSTVRDNVNAITGKRSYNLTNGAITKIGLTNTKTYIITIWSKTGVSVTVNGISLTTPIETHLGWNLYSTIITGVSNITITGNGLIDELRLHPNDANMQTVTYEPLVGETSIADANNNITYNEYDNLNRLILVRNKDRNILKKMDYNGDTAKLMNMLPNWQYKSNYCSFHADNLPYQDSLFVDVNIWSDSFNLTKFKPTLTLPPDCSCVVGNPEFHIANGVCERSYLRPVSSTYKKVLINGNYEWRWKCVYRYCFTDGFQSVDISTEYNLDPCTIDCSVPL